MRFGPTGIWIGNLEILTYYGIILMAGAVAAAFLSEWLAKKRGMKSETVWDALIWVLIGGVIGARIWHILTPSPSLVAQGVDTMYYLTHPLDALNFRAGGLGIPGAVLGGGLALYWYTRRNKLNFGEWADIAAPAVALGQAIGRWGNFVNQELYGRPTDLPWGIFIEREGGRFHPLFLYESLWNLMNMALLLWLGKTQRQRLKDGDLLLIYLIMYPLGRFLLEFLRLDSAIVWGLNANQTIMGIVAVGAAVWLYLRHRPQPHQKAE